MAWYHRLRNLMRGDALSRDLDRELEFHIAERAEELVGQGMSEREALREARRRFGHVQQREGADPRRGRRRVARVAGGGRALRVACAPREPRLHAGRRDLDRPRRRRQHGDLQPHQRRDAEVAPGSACGGAGARCALRRQQPGSGFGGDRVHQSALGADPRPPGRGGRLCVRRRVVQPRFGRRGAPRRGEPGKRKLLPRPRRPPAGRTPADAQRRQPRLPRGRRGECRLRESGVWGAGGRARPLRVARRPSLRRRRRDRAVVLRRGRGEPGPGLRADLRRGDRAGQREQARWRAAPGGSS